MSVNDRQNFGKLKEVIEPPNLILNQIDSFRDFFQKDVPHTHRKPIGLEAVFREVFPILSYDERSRLEYVSYAIGEPKFSEMECIREKCSYSAPLQLKLRLRMELEGQSKPFFSEEEIFMGEIPIITDRGSFVINGAERVVVSQLHRSPGVSFEETTHTSGKTLHAFRIIPDRGTWIEAQFDQHDLLYVYLDRRRRRRKFLITTFLRALLDWDPEKDTDSDQKLLELFYEIESLKVGDLLDQDNVSSYVLVEPMFDRAKGVVLAKAFEPLTKTYLRAFRKAGISELRAIDTSSDDGAIIRCLKKDVSRNKEDALKEIYKKLRPGEPPERKNAEALVRRLFQDPKRYDLARVGRHMLNMKLGLDTPLDVRVTTVEDIVAATKRLTDLKRGISSEEQARKDAGSIFDMGIDDIDHLGNRRVRTVGELLANVCRSGLARTERVVRERMTLYDQGVDSLTPGKLINPKALTTVLRDFFARSQLSQFMDQINPLAEITHKRRLSALGPGGLNRERAGFEVRDVHPTHYGRICPIETPEGPNIGLINSLSTYAKIDEFGFLQSPYHPVVDGVVNKNVEDVTYLNAFREESFRIAQANSEVDPITNKLKGRPTCRYRDTVAEFEPSKVDFIDVSPKQVVSVAVGLIPFIEHDDARRALMGANMQRQAVPLIQTEAPLVGTGIEHRVAKDSKAILVSRSEGIVALADSNRIVLTDDGNLPARFLREPKSDPKRGVHCYDLRKFMRSNSGTCFNQKPIVRKGDKVRVGQSLADGACTSDGELALGRNILVAFMPWKGYNFGDAIVISEKLVRDDLFTSIHIEEFEVTARDTRLGPEEITRNIPDAGEEALRNLDHRGVVRIGAEIKPGDILVGKITPKPETDLADEEKLLRAIFGERAADVKDSSLKVPSGTFGIVMDVKISSRTEAEQEKLSPSDNRFQIKQIKEDYRNQSDDLRSQLTESLSNILLGEKIPLNVKNSETGDVIIPANRKITKTLLRRLSSVHRYVDIPPSPVRIKVFEIIEGYENKFKDLDDDRDRKIEAVERGDPIDQGAIKNVRVFVAKKQKIRVGDKMAGRHGNKGVVAKIVAEEDMPCLPDGTPVELIIDSHGIPSRMNVGQVLETHLGWACKKLGLSVATPIFDGIPEKNIQDYLRQAELPETGKTQLVDGCTGEPFFQQVVVGYMYMLKLNHLVSGKIHARGVGPYSLITQQPLGGKAQYGGQRFGEMEVWALEAYGAAYTLQEMMTVKSDDVTGRTKIYENLVMGDNSLQASTPQSFNVLMKEMQSLCLDVRVGIGLSGVDAAKEALGIEVGPMDRVSITVASPDVIRSWARGEAKNPETINYRTFKPEPGGLFCQKIFGPVRDYECACGKYKRIQYKGVVCDRCGVEVTVSRVRRERMGNIELAVPVCHIWFLKSMPSRLGLLLNMTAKSLERVLYYEQYMVTDAGTTPLEEKQLLSDREFRLACDEYGDEFEAKMGAEALMDVLSRMDLEESLEELYEQMHETTSKQIKKKLSNRLKIIQGFISSGVQPEWMILETIPVIPPDLRPLVPLEGGRFATSDLNDLYRRVINRNNRLKNLLQLKTPDVIIHNEKRMLQESVDALFDNGRHGRAITGSGNRALKSLSDMLKGKQGRFRQNLLGKRVDYSGRSVIVIGPELKLHQCGLPKKMALTLFEPFIIRRLKELGFVHTVRGARRMIEGKSPEVWDILEEVTRGHPVLLNRAPTLHRLSVMAFEPVLVEGNAIRIHPLVCTPYNADFDGDQMAVHVPLSLEAIMEAKLLMLSTRNIFSPSSGKPILMPHEAIVSGAYYLTMNPRGEKPEEGKRLPLIDSVDETLTAMHEGALKLHDWIDLRNPDKGRDTIFGISGRSVIRTTVGRVIFNTIWPKELGFFNEPALKGGVGDLILETFKALGKEETVASLDRLKELGFEYATKSGISIGIFDMIIPPTKEEKIVKARKEIDKVEEQFKKGIITRGERHNKIIDVWTNATDDIAKEVYNCLEENQGKDTINPVYLMMDSGARGNRQQVRQLCGMRGLMAKPSGEIIEQPILSSFREGLSVLEYFMSTHGARKGLADTALKTADAGYLTRKLCDVAMDTIIECKDDGRRDGVWKKAIVDGDNEIVPLRQRITGRYSSEDIPNPSNPSELIVRSGDLITEEIAEQIDSSGILRARILSPFSTRLKNGISALEYGIDPSTNKLVVEGAAIGIIAAQSIGEPGTQLTMRTFHIGGVASAGRQDPVINTRSAGKLHFRGLRLVTLENGQQVTLNKTGSIQVKDEYDRVLDDYPVPAGALLHFKQDDDVQADDLLAQWDPYNIPILSEKQGVVAFMDMIPGVTTKGERDASGGTAMVVIEHKEDLNPQVEIRDEKGKIIAIYSIPTGVQVCVDEGTRIDAGSIIAKTPRQTSKTQDITRGLPRVAELFEARRPKEGNVGQMAKIDGIVSEAGTLRSKKRLLITNEESGQVEEHLIPHGKHVLVQPGDFAYKGQLVTDGAKDPHEILDILGPSAVQEYLIEEIQKVYRLQGVTINDKHLEVIISRMLFNVRIIDPGDTEFFWGDQIDRFAFMDANEEIVEKAGKPADGEPILLGITKASLETDSFLSAASFQETTRVLTTAATLGKEDDLRGFKENLIMGGLIPAGTGLPKWRRLKIDTLGSVPAV